VPDGEKQTPAKLAAQKKWTVTVQALGGSAP
jgi:hypothetical protein